jgi:hypothetical protein
VSSNLNDAPQSLSAVSSKDVRAASAPLAWLMLEMATKNNDATTCNFNIN